MVVKICGLTRLADVDACAAAGVDWLGFNLWPQSKRYVPTALAQDLARRGRMAGLKTVALLVKPSYDDIAATLKLGAFDMLQLYEAPNRLPVGLQWIESMPATDTAIPDPSKKRGDYSLVETKVDGFGGAGKSFDWRLLQALPSLDRTLIGGGITPENLPQLLQFVRPFGIDVASGVESAPGLKDVDKIRKLMAAVSL